MYNRIEDKVTVSAFHLMVEVQASLGDLPELFTIDGRRFKHSRFKRAWILRVLQQRGVIASTWRETWHGKARYIRKYRVYWNKSMQRYIVRATSEVLPATSEAANPNGSSGNWRGFALAGILVLDHLFRAKGTP